VLERIRRFGLKRQQTLSNCLRGSPRGHLERRRQAMGMALEPMARFGNVFARGLIQVSEDLRDLERGGRWAVAVPFQGAPMLAQFSDWSSELPDQGQIGVWGGVPVGDWQSSVDRDTYVESVESTRERIARGDVYQANICRVRSAPLPSEADVLALDMILQQGNPAPFSGALRLPSQGIHIASASPELFLSRSDDVISSGPIKGTAADASGLSEKDRAENIMIVDLVRNDLSQCAVTGSVHTVALLEVEQHPGLVQLVSKIDATLIEGTTWSDLFSATFPPGSVTGAPKISALEIIRELEPAPRSFYCGAFGWIDAENKTAQLAVAIRTFWFDRGELKFGTGAGITWNSDAHAEWEETELKARNLTNLAAKVSKTP